MNKFSFNIIGAGAIGHLWTSFLNRKNYCAKLYARTSRPAQNFTVESAGAHFKQRIDYHQLSDWKDADAILVCVKAHQLEALCSELAAFKPAPAKMILMMNGMGLVEIAQQYLPQMTLLHASLLQGAYLKEQTIRHTGNGKTLIGDIAACHSYSKKADTNRLQQDCLELIAQLNHALPQVSWNHQQHQSLHLKLIVNAIINPLTALADQPNACILQDGKLNKQAYKLLDELKPLFPKLLPKLEFNRVKAEVEAVASNTKENISSMLQDVRAGKTTEIDYINGYLIKIAKGAHIKLPAHAKLLTQIKSLSQAEGKTCN